VKALGATPAAGVATPTDLTNETRGKLKISSFDPVPIPTEAEASAGNTSDKMSSVLTR